MRVEKIFFNTEDNVSSLVYYTQVKAKMIKKL